MTKRALSVIANEIVHDWREVQGRRIYFGAVPYLDAMRCMVSIHDNYGADDGRSIVAYALSNLTTWRGETARRVKAELRDMLKAAG